ncbi:D-alanyl-D-alanine carboxypeptidase family protein [Saccharibacillus alkalitolerans]|uniref:M15 family metallopeptidase n=1 Tax=Saccharibacillus alkalitolerans TaxID=2705290 RepID=A0ABX0F8K1_9BACL|nr:D-alanyl-D-alanine carboxypeptidase family protein [Saccharibacillus alkalitolerans]NGZ77273.1 M15 family metallopeptidase [Saccharibacillus alkalitolerans]
METRTPYVSRINGDRKNTADQANPLDRADQADQTNQADQAIGADRTDHTDGAARTHLPHPPHSSRSGNAPLGPDAEHVPVLVNRDHPAAESPADTEQRLAPVGSRPGIRALDDGIRLDRTCLNRLDALLDAVSGKDGIVVVSGYRDLAEQTEIYSSSLRENGPAYTAKFVALPGCSEHHTGLAVDVGSAAGGLDFIAPEFPDDGVCGAFKARAAEFGFVQRYKAHKEHLTGISCEPWHFRYVGAAHAAIMEERDLCLEEYVEWLRRQADGKHGNGEDPHGH